MDILFSDVVLINSSSTVSNYASPLKLGFPLQIYLMKKMSNIPYVVSAKIVFISIIIINIITLSLFFISIILFPNDLILEKISINPDVIYLILFPVFMALFFFVFLYIKYDSSFFNKLREYKINSKLFDSINFYFLFWSSFFICCSFFLNTLLLYFTIIGLGQNVNIFPLFFIQSIPLVLGKISMIPFGLGIKDISLTYVLQSMDISADIAIATSIINRLLVTGFSFGVGFFSINYLFNKNILTSGTIDNLKND